MSSGLLRIVIIVAILAGLSASALGQYEAANKARFGAGVAFTRPSDSALSNIKGTWMGVNIDVHLAYDENERPKELLSIGWFGNESGLSNATLFPIKATYIKRFGQSDFGGWYVGGGPDLYYANCKIFDFDPIQRANVLSNDKGFRLGLGVVCGLEFGGAWYAEARYDKVGALDRANGGTIDLSGLTITLGTRVGL
jgi:hypothetical protein